ncbi:hypothetical protein AAC387_Pa07g2354 [Persea americana]
MRKGEVRNQAERVSVWRMVEMMGRSLKQRSTAEMRWGGCGREGGGGGVVRGRAEKASEKKAWWSERRWERGEWLVEGQDEVQRQRQRGGWAERKWRWEEAQLAEARAGPSRRLRMWVRTSGGRAEMVVAPLDSPELVVVKVVRSVYEGDMGTERERSGGGCWVQEFGRQ